VPAGIGRPNRALKLCRPANPGITRRPTSNAPPPLRGRQSTTARTAGTKARPRLSMTATPATRCPAVSASDAAFTVTAAAAHAPGPKQAPTPADIGRGRTPGSAAAPGAVKPAATTPATTPVSAAHRNAPNQFERKVTAGRRLSRHWTVGHTQRTIAHDQGRGATCGLKFVNPPRSRG
jgi:hypothetical protein